MGQVIVEPHFVHNPTHGHVSLPNVSLWFYCEVSQRNPPLPLDPNLPLPTTSESLTGSDIELFKGDGTSPFRIPLRPGVESHPPTPQDRRAVHYFAFTLFENLPHSHTWLVNPHLPPSHPGSAPRLIEVRYRLMATSHVCHIPPRGLGEAVMPLHTVFGSRIVTLTAGRHDPVEAYLPPHDARLDVVWSFPRPATNTRALPRDHAIAVAVGLRVAAMGVPLSVCVRARVPGAASIRVGAAIIERVTVEDAQFRPKKSSGRVADARVGASGEATFRFEVTPRSRRLFPDTDLGPLDVDHAVEACVIAWAGPGDGAWRMVPEGALAVRVPIIVVPRSPNDQWTLIGLVR